MAVCLPAFLIYITEGGGQQSSSYLVPLYLDKVVVSPIVFLKALEKG
jgi:hypothetical protein